MNIVKLILEEIERKPKRLLTEKLGVPDNIDVESEKLYKHLLSFLTYHDYFVVHIDLMEEETSSVSYRLSKPITVGDEYFDGFEIEVIIKNTKESEQRLKKNNLLSLAIPSNTKFQIKTKRFDYKTLDNYFYMSITFMTNTDEIRPDELKSIILSNVTNEKEKVTSHIAHELKHAFVNRKQKSVKTKSILKYATMSPSSFPFNIKTINNFFFNSYFTHEIESHVRTSEIYTSMKAKNINSKNFRNFLLNDKIYKKLKEIKDYTYDKFIQDLKKDENGINELLIFMSNSGVIPNTYSIEEKIKFAIHATVRNIDNESTMVLNNLFKSASRSVFSQSFNLDQKDIQEIPIFLTKLSNQTRKYLTQPEKFFIDKINEMSRLADKAIKRISKLYAHTT